MDQLQSILCPVCQTKIHFDPRQLLMGEKFTCINCRTDVGLAPESKGKVEDTMNKFDQLKNKISKEKQKPTDDSVI